MSAYSIALHNDNTGIGHAFISLAMASLTPPAMGQTTLSQTYQDALASNWQ